MLDRFQELIRHAVSYEDSTRNGLSIRLSWSDETQTSYEEWARLGERLMPVVTHELRRDGRGGSSTSTLPTPF